MGQTRSGHVNLGHSRGGAVEHSGVGDGGHSRGGAVTHSGVGGQSKGHSGVGGQSKGHSGQNCATIVVGTHSTPEIFDTHALE